MMKPLSRTKRLLYLLGFGLIFVVATPLLIFYARGYRLTESLGITHTGGLFVSTPLSGAKVYINDELVRETSIFQKNVLVQNLKPGSYKILVEKENHSTWQKALDVFAETVTEGHSFLLTKNPGLIEISPIIKIEGQSTTTQKRVTPEKNPEYTRVVKLFTPPKPKVATTTDIKVLGKLYINKTFGKLQVSWRGNVEEIPSYFCRNQACKEEIIITAPSPIKSFDFFPGRSDLIVMGLAEGVYVGEFDDRSPQNIVPLLTGENLDIRVSDNTIFVKQGDKYYTVVL